MTVRAKFQVLKVTETAAARVREIVANADRAVAGLRLGVRKGGCAGMEYAMELVEAPRPGDDVVEIDGARIFVDPSAVLFLLGTEMDFEVTKLRSGFVFRNPNEVSACGCGESVELRPADPATLQTQPD